MSIGTTLEPAAPRVLLQEAKIERSSSILNTLIDKIARLFHYLIQLISFKDRTLDVTITNSIPSSDSINHLRGTALATWKEIQHQLQMDLHRMNASISNERIKNVDDFVFHLTGKAHSDLDPQERVFIENMAICSQQGILADPFIVAEMNLFEKNIITNGSLPQNQGKTTKITIQKLPNSLYEIDLSNHSFYSKASNENKAVGIVYLNAKVLMNSHGEVQKHTHSYKFVSL